MKRTSAFIVMFLSLALSVAAWAAPANTAGQFADINGARIFYTVSGQGEPLILIRGYPLSSDLFDENRDALSRVFMVITLDLRGFGRSVAPDANASIDVYANDVIALMNMLGVQKAVIGGHSMGGITTLDIYSKVPDRFDGMLLIDTVAAPSPTVERAIWRGYAAQANEDGAQTIIKYLLPQFLSGDAGRSEPDLVDAVTGIVNSASVNGLVGGANALADRPDLRPVLSRITVPTLILFGEEDPLTSIEIAKMLHAGIATSQLAIIDEGSHATILETARQANRVILRWARQTLGVQRKSGMAGDEEDEDADGR